MELSRDAIEREIRLAIKYGNPRSAEIAAAKIWAAIERSIVESENRVIDAEFVLQEKTLTPEQ